MQAFYPCVSLIGRNAPFFSPDSPRTSSPEEPCGPESQQSALAASFYRALICKVVKFRTYWAINELLYTCTDHNSESLQYIMLFCFMTVVSFLGEWGEGAGFIYFGKNPGHVTPNAGRERLTGSQNSSRQGNYCLGDPEIQGQLCFNKPGNVPPL